MLTVSPAHACADLLVCAQDDQHHQVLELVLTTLTDKRTLFHFSILSQDTQRLVHAAVQQRLPALLPAFLRHCCDSDCACIYRHCNKPDCPGPAMKWLCHAAGPAAVSSASAARAVLNSRDTIDRQSLAVACARGFLHKTHLVTVAGTVQEPGHALRCCMQLSATAPAAAPTLNTLVNPPHPVAIFSAMKTTTMAHQPACLPCRSLRV